MLRTQTMNQSESHVSVCVWFWPHVNEPIVQEEHGASRASTKINLTEKSPVVRMATERAVGLQTMPQQDALCVWVYVVAQQPILSMRTVVWSGSPAKFNKGLCLHHGQKKQKEKRETGRSKRILHQRYNF